MRDITNRSFAANYFKGIEGVGGKLFFKEDCLMFKSHVLNIQSGETIINYNAITSVAKRNTLGIVPNGLSIITKDGKEHKFVVNKRKEILEFLESKLN